jgi:hypothetical protein
MYLLCHRSSPVSLHATEEDAEAWARALNLDEFLQDPEPTRTLRADYHVVKPPVVSHKPTETIFYERIAVFSRNPKEPPLTYHRRESRMLWPDHTPASAEVCVNNPSIIHVRGTDWSAVDSLLDDLVAKRRSAYAAAEKAELP